MKVLMIGNHESVCGGITSVIQQILSYDWEKDNIIMEFLPSYKGGNLLYKLFFFRKTCRKLKKIIKHEKPDVIYVHMSHHGSFFRANKILKICKKNKIHMVVHLHGSEFADYYNGSSSRLKLEISNFFNECKAVIVLGEKWKKCIESISENSNVIIINNSVPIPEHYCLQSVNKIHFLFLGVLIPRKGVIDFLEAFKNVLRDKNFIQGKDIVLNIGGEGSEKERLISYVTENKIGEYVNFLGWVSGDKKKNALCSNNVFVLPSYNEGLPISILEALSFGMPVISTNVGSINEAVIDGENGYLINPGDIENMEKAIRVMIKDETKRKNMGEKSRLIAENNFSENVFFESLKTILTE